VFPLELHWLESRPSTTTTNSIASLGAPFTHPGTHGINRRKGLSDRVVLASGA